MRTNGSLQVTLERLGKTKVFLEDATLDLSKQNLTISDIPDIVSWLKDKTPSSLSTLNLAGNALSSQEPLHTFSLANDYKMDNVSASPGSSYGSFGVLPSVSFHPLEKLFLQFKGWKSVNVSRNGLAPMEMASLIEALRTHSDVTDLVLDHNVLGERGVEQLELLLKENTSLKYLSLVSCHLTTPHVMLLAKALEGNQSLRELDVSQNNAVDQNEVGRAFNRLLHKNQHLTKIIFDDSGLLLPLREYIKGKLTSNQEKQQALQNHLLSPLVLFEEAKRAIERDERDWLRVLLGSGFNKDQGTRFVAQQEAYLTQKCLLEFQGNLISEQLLKLNDYKGKNLIHYEERQIVQEGFDFMLKECTKQAAKHYKKGLKRWNAYQRLDGQAQQEAYNVRLKRFHNLLESQATEFAIVFHFDMEWEELRRTLTEKKAQIEGTLTTLIAQNHEITEAHNAHQQTHMDLLKCAETLHRQGGLPRAYQVEFEEMKERLVATRLDVTLQDERGNTLLHDAFLSGKKECLLLLLQAGANLLQKDRARRDHLSVLEIVFKEGIQGRCHEAVIQYIKQTLRDVWPNPLQKELSKETVLLQEVKEKIDNYIDILLMNMNRFFLIQLITGAYWHLEVRQQDCAQYYRYVQEANEHENAISVVSNIIFYAQHAKRGSLGRSRLHDEVIKAAKIFQEHLQDPATEYAERLAAAKVDQSLLHKMERQAVMWEEKLESLREEKEKDREKDRIEFKQMLVEKDQRIEQVLLEKEMKSEGMQREIRKLQQGLQETQTLCNQLKSTKTENEVHELRQELNEMKKMLLDKQNFSLNQKNQNREEKEQPPSLFSFH